MRINLYNNHKPMQLKNPDVNGQFLNLGQILSIIWVFRIKGFT